MVVFKIPPFPAQRFEPEMQNEKSCPLNGMCLPPCPKMVGTDLVYLETGVGIKAESAGCQSVVAKKGASG